MLREETLRNRRKQKMKSSKSLKGKVRAIRILIVAIGINTFCMAMPVRQRVYSIRLTRLCIILKRMVKVRHIYHKNREY